MTKTTAAHASGRYTLSVFFVAIATFGIFSVYPGSGQAAVWPQVYQDHASEVVLIIAAGSANKRPTLQTGVWISPEGKLITAAQGLFDPKTKQPVETIYVYTKPAQLAEKTADNLLNRYRARLLAGDTQSSGLALLQIEDAPVRIQTAVLDSAPLLPGPQTFLVIGHTPEGGVWSGQLQQQIEPHLAAKHAPQNEAWAYLNVPYDKAQLGAPVYSEQGRVRGLVIAGACEDASGCDGTLTQMLGSFELVRWLAQNNMSLAVPGAPPADDPDSASDNPTPQPSTIQVVGTAADADWVRRQMAPNRSVTTLPRPVQTASVSKIPQNNNKSFVAPLRPFCLSTTLAKELEPLSVPKVGIQDPQNKNQAPKLIRKPSP